YSWLTSLELCRPFFEKGGCAFLLVFRSGTKPEKRGFQCEAFILTRFQSFVYCFERILHGERCVGKYLFQNRLSPQDQIRCWHNFVEESDAISLRSTDDFASKNELQRTPFPNQSRKPLRSAAAGKQSQFDFRLAKLRGLSGDPDCASHRRLAP